jgi:hypothetical protein
LSNKIEFVVLTSGLDKFQKDLGTASESLASFSKTAKSIGRDLSQVGSTISLLGASISGPLILAFNNAAKSSLEVSNQVKRFKDVANAFQNDIAKNLVPVFEKLNNMLTYLYKSFSSLDAAFKQQLIQGAMITGIFLTMGGVLTLVVAKTILLASAMASLASKFLLFALANPAILAVGASIAAVVILMYEFKGVADVVMSTFQVLFMFLQNGFLTVKIAIEGTIYSIAESAQAVIDLLAKIPGPTQNAMLILSNEAQNLSNVMRSGMLQDMKGVSDNASEIGNIMASGQGTWSIAFDELKTKAQELFAQMASPDAVSAIQLTWTQVWDKLKITFSNGGKYFKQINDDMLGSLTSTLQGAAQLNSKWANAYKAVAMGEAVMSTASGVARALKDYPFPASIIVGAIVAAMGAVQIATIASQSFAVGTPEIPRDMVAQVHKGETIIPESFADSIRSGELSLSGGGAQGGGGVMFNFEGATFNGVTETFVREIFTKASESIRNRTLAALPA